MIVMMTASTPSLKASIRPLVIHTPFWFKLKLERPCGVLRRCLIPLARECCKSSEVAHLARVSILEGLTHTGLVQERFPVAWNSPRWARCRLTGRMRMRRQQFHALDHPLLFVIEKPVLTRFEDCAPRMSIQSRMF